MERPRGTFYLLFHSQLLDSSQMFLLKFLSSDMQQEYMYKMNGIQTIYILGEIYLVSWQV